MIPLKVVDSSESELDEILDEESRRIIVMRVSKITQDANQLLNGFKENTHKYQPDVRKAKQDIEEACVDQRGSSVQ